MNRSNGVFPALIDRAFFDAAQTIIKSRSLRLSDDEMLEALRILRQSTGLLSGLIIDDAEGLPSSSVYRSRFGSLLRAYSLVDHPVVTIAISKSIAPSGHSVPKIVSDIMDGFRSTGCHLTQDPETDLITINDETTLSIVISAAVRPRRVLTAGVSDLKLAFRPTSPSPCEWTRGIRKPSIAIYYRASTSPVTGSGSPTTVSDQIATASIPRKFSMSFSDRFPSWRLPDDRGA